MDAIALAHQMQRFGRWLDRLEHPALERHAMNDDIEVTIDAASTSPAASFNTNRIHLSGDVSQAALAAAVRLVDQRRIARCFAWVGPGGDIERTRQCLDDLSFERVVWTRYPTLRLVEPAETARASSFDIRVVTPTEIASARPVLGDTLFDGYVRTAGLPGFRHYMAFDEEQPIAAATLVQWEDIGYLTHAATLESARRRGAQSALIAHRVHDAHGLGCRSIVSQTLTMLTSSLNNLHRAGFREVFDFEVYERNVESAAA